VEDVLPRSLPPSTLDPFPRIRSAVLCMRMTFITSSRCNRCLDDAWVSSPTPPKSASPLQSAQGGRFEILVLIDENIGRQQRTAVVSVIIRHRHPLASLTCVQVPRRNPLRRFGIPGCRNACENHGHMYLINPPLCRLSFPPALFFV
jgi:hypothetical protein